MSGGPSTHPTWALLTPGGFAMSTSTYYQRFLTTEERFWAKCDKNGPPWNGTPCWVWTGYLTKRGYGHFRNGLAMLGAHRWAYEAIKGTIPTGFELDHLCRVPACVNPEHLEAVSHRVNILRGNSFAAREAQRPRCNKGHPFDLFNTRFLSRGGRECRACRRKEPCLWGRLRSRPLRIFPKISRERKAVRGAGR